MRSDAHVIGLVFICCGTACPTYSDPAIPGVGLADRDREWKPLRNGNLRYERLEPTKGDRRAKM